MQFRAVTLFTFLWMTIMLAAQSPEGAIVGTVSDATGARIAGAKITAAIGELALTRSTQSGSRGEFRIELLPPGLYEVTVEALDFAPLVAQVTVSVSATPTLNIKLQPGTVRQSITVEAKGSSVADQPVETTNSEMKSTAGVGDLRELPLAHRSFANIAYLAPMTQPVEPSDPTKARITAVSFGGSSGLNVDLSVDGGDNNDDYIGGFLQNFSPDAIQEFTVRTAQFNADTSRTNGGSVIISSRRGTNDWHGDLSGYFRASGLNARNPLDNPKGEPKQPFSRENGVAAAGGPLVKDKLWLFSSLEYVNEDASVGYSALSLGELNALAKIASMGQIPGVRSISVPGSVGTPFHDAIASTRLDYARSQRSHWFLRGAFDLNHTGNDLVHQGALPSTGFTTDSRYYSLLLSNQMEWAPSLAGNFVFQASRFHHEKLRNGSLGFALAFPISANFHTTSGFETFGDNQFVTPITRFPVQRDQQKYQFRYDLSKSARNHAFKAGVNFIHEPVLSGRLADNAERLILFTTLNPSNLLAQGQSLAPFFTCDPAAVQPDPSACPVDGAGNPLASITDVAAGGGRFKQSVRRLGFYGQDAWRVNPSFTVNYGIRYDTTFGLFDSNGGNQTQNPAVLAVAAQNLALPHGIPSDYRGAVAPRLGIAWAPRGSENTVLRAGAGLYYNDLAQNGWVDAFRAVTPGITPVSLAAGQQGAIIDPNYHSPYALQASAGFERLFTNNWHLNIFYEHQQGVHQYRRYEYVANDPVAAPNGVLPAGSPNISVFRTDNRSRYDGVAFAVSHRFTGRFEMTAHYTLAHATTYGAVAGELFDYVNGVSDVRNPFGPGDHGPSGEDVRHRLVIAGTLRLPWQFELSTLSQFESARPFTLATGIDFNGDGVRTDRAVINGKQTTLDQFRGTPFQQVDLRLSRNIKINERMSVRPFIEFFNLLNRQNPGNNYIGDIAALPVPAAEVAAGNVTHTCGDAACTVLNPITNINRVKAPGGALGDFFGPGTTVGGAFSAQLGVRFSF